MQYKNFQEAAENIDWRLLQQQKKTLEKLLLVLPLEMQTSGVLNKNLSNLWGLIELIETLQDMHSNEMS